MDDAEIDAEIAFVNSRARTADSTRTRSRGFQAGMTIPSLKDEQTESGQCSKLRDQVIREIKRVVPQDSCGSTTTLTVTLPVIYVGLFEPHFKLEQILDRSDKRWGILDGGE